MGDQPNRPKEYDAVLGGQNPPPLGAIVLGGIEGVKHRLASSAVETRIAALFEAPKYSELGWRLIVDALFSDNSKQLQAEAYRLLHKRTEPNIEQALQTYSPGHYQFFECIKTIDSGHSSYLNVVVLDPQGKKLASGSSDRHIRVWDIQTGELSYVLNQNSEVISALAFSPDGQNLYSNNGNEIKLWDLRKKKEIRTFKGHERPVVSLAIAPDGKLISGARDKINIYDRPGWGGTYRTLEKYPPQTWAMNSVKVALSADGKKLICCSSIDRSIEIWDWKKRRPIGIVGEEIYHSNYYRGLYSLAISPDGKMAASGGYNQIDVWNLQTRRKLYTISLEKETEEVESLAIAPDGKALFGTINNGAIKIWDLYSAKEIHTLKGHSSTVTSIAIGADGLSIVSGCIDRTIKIWGLPPTFAT